MTYLIEHIQSNDLPELRLLTATERRILKLVAQGKTSKEIAEELFVSVRTVETHRHNMCRKMNLTGVHALLQFAIENQSRL
jgi:DNA-binding CsgD family transcriptional regulator